MGRVWVSLGEGGGMPTESGATSYVALRASGVPVHAAGLYRASGPSKRKHIQGQAAGGTRTPASPSSSSWLTSAV